MLTNISLCIVSQTGYFSRLPFFSMIFLEVTNNEALAFWAFLGLLKRDWAVPFFSNDSFFDAMFHIEMLTYIIEAKFPQLKGKDINILLSEELFNNYKKNIIVILDIIFTVI